MDLDDEKGDEGEGDDWEAGSEKGRDVRRKDGVRWKALLAPVLSSRRTRSARRIELCLQRRF